MTKEKSRKMSKNLSKEITSSEVSWDTAILDAEQKIRELKSQIAKLKVAIKVFKERRDAGVPFPGHQSNKNS